MTHIGKAPAIYMQDYSVVLLERGDHIPDGYKFIISHSHPTALALAFHKSTDGYLDGSRQSHLGVRSYSENVEAVLQRVVSDRIEEVSLYEFQILRHALGSSHLSQSQPDLGWRNFFACDDSHTYVNNLVRRKLMAHRDGVAVVTDRGKMLAGAPQLEGK